MAEKVNINAYFERIGFAGSIAPTLATLEALHALHPATIPFENLDALIGEAVALDQPSLERKLLHERRGGYCFEHNLLFMRVLEDLDYVVRPLLAYGLWTDPENRERSHVVLLLDINGQHYLADVGHGGLTLTAPLRLRADIEQQTPHETFRLLNSETAWTLEVKIGEEWRLLYGFLLDKIEDADIAKANQMVSTYPSPLTTEIRVAMAPPGKRFKLHNTCFTIQPTGEAAEKRDIASMETLRSVLTDTFGITLPNDERLEPAFAKILPPPAEPQA